MALTQLPVIDVEGPKTVWITEACRLEPHANTTWVYAGGALFAILRPGDDYQAKLVAAQLVRMGAITAPQAAQAFGYHPNSIRHWVQQLQCNGTLHERDFKRGPVGPSKMTPELFRFIQAQPRGRANRSVAEAITQQFDVHLSAETVR